MNELLRIKKLALPVVAVCTTMCGNVKKSLQTFAYIYDVIYVDGDSSPKEHNLSIYSDSEEHTTRILLQNDVVYGLVLAPHIVLAPLY